MTSYTGTYEHFPTRVFVGAVAVVCVAMAVSAISSYTSMIELRNLYLEDRAHEVSATLTERLRGPDRLDPDAWRPIIDETLQSGSYPWLKYVALIEPNGQPLTSGGRQSNDLYLYETAVRTPRWGRQGGRFGPPGLRQEHDSDQPARLKLANRDRSIQRGIYYAPGVSPSWRVRPGSFRARRSRVFFRPDSSTFPGAASGAGIPTPPSGSRSTLRDSGS